MNYKEQLDHIRFTPEQKADMVEQILAAQSQPVPRKRKFHLPRMAVIGVAAAMVLTIGAGASGALRSAGEAFAGVFGRSAAETEIIDKIGRPIGASDSNNGVTITADAIIGDKYHYAITYTITKDDGSAFDMADDIGNGYLPLMFEQQDTYFGNMGGAHGTSYFYDADPNDNAIQFVEMRETDREIPHSTAKATFENIRMQNNGQDDILVNGKWKLKFEMNFEDTAISLPAGQTMQLNGMDIEINAITLSPIALRVDYTVDSEIKWDENAKSGRVSEKDRKSQQKYFEDLRIFVNKKDGTSIDLSLSGGSVKPEDGKTICQKGEVFEQILPLEDIASITVGDLEIPVNV